jgi:hypothetical protein
MSMHNARSHGAGGAPRLLAHGSSARTFLGTKKGACIIGLRGFLYLGALVCASSYYPHVSSARRVVAHEHA